VLRWLAAWWEAIRREASVPAPPFHACKRVAVIMNGVWYGRLSPDQARAKAAGWGFTPEAIEDMISQATQPPSYWSAHPQSSAPDAE
jgi:(2Fe-2S) ferredoxin